MGFLSWFKRRKVVGKQAVEAEGQEPAGKTTLTIDGDEARSAGTPAAAPATTDASPATTSTATKSDACAAITAAGTPCKGSARPGSKYCGRHKGYRAATGAKNGATNGAATGARNGAAAKTNGRRSQVEHNGYKLFQNGNRYFFSKKAQKDVTGQPVYDMPEGRSVTTTPNGLPVLKKA